MTRDGLIESRDALEYVPASCILQRVLRSARSRPWRSPSSFGRRRRRGRARKTYRRISRSIRYTNAVCPDSPYTVGLVAGGSPRRGRVRPEYAIAPRATRQMARRVAISLVYFLRW